MASHFMMQKTENKMKNCMKTQTFSLTPSLNSSPNPIQKQGNLSKSKKFKFKQKLENPKQILESQNLSQKQFAKEKYREWLRASLESLKKIKSLEKLEKIKKKEEKQKKEEEKIKKNEEAQRAFEKWLENKKKTKKNLIPVKKKSNLKQKKVLMLAYSLNKKVASSLSSIEETTVPEKSEASSKGDNFSKENEQNFVVFPEYFEKYSSYDTENKVFEEVSSIGKVSKIQGVFYYEEDSDSLVYDLNLGQM